MLVDGPPVLAQPCSWTAQRSNTSKNTQCFMLTLRSPGCLMQARHVQTYLPAKRIRMLEPSAPPARILQQKSHWPRLHATLMQACTHGKNWRLLTRMATPISRSLLAMALLGAAIHREPRFLPHSNRSRSLVVHGCGHLSRHRCRCRWQRSQTCHHCRCRWNRSRT